MKLILIVEVGVVEKELDDFLDKITEDITNGEASREYVVEFEEWEIFG